jgi:hypothetical protein
LQIEDERQQVKKERESHFPGESWLLEPNWDLLVKTERSSAPLCPAGNLKALELKQEAAM